MKYLSGFVTGFLCGGGAVCAALLYLHWSEVIDLHMLDKNYVRKMYQPKGPWIRNHFDYSYHGRHYSPYHSTVTEAKPAWQVNPECSGCVYEGMSADFNPCKSCKRAFDGCSTDYFEAREPEPEAEETHKGQCYKCKYFEREDDEAPCVNCRNSYFHDKGLEDLFEADEEV